MNKHIIIVEHNKENILKSTYSAISAAQNISNDISALILAKDEALCKLLAKEILQYVSNVIYICNNDFDNPISQSYASGISHIINKFNYNYVWAGSSSFMKEVMPRVSARIEGSATISDIQKVIDKDTFERPMWAGDVIATVKTNSAVKLITIRPTDFQEKLNCVENSKSECVAYDIQQTTTKFVAFDEIKSERPPLSEASVVISGGRGLKDPDTFKKLIFPLADTMNAAVGASRAICDADWVPNDWQVGQTGKVVAPDLYFAIGISGAIQHVAGIRGSKVIIAINKDAEAPIFQISDYGIIGDALEIIPELTEKIKALLK